ncbi:MAG: type II toxin-antitoxin system HicB family antitoxin [Halodesulfurarchaeum sp.]|nr:type II toxin-antitoxin system HicB family antitoxin [Halodesulfurarchaeum sp.]
MGAVSHRDEPGVRFTYEGDLVTATDTERGVAASGQSKAEALSRLSDALELHDGEGLPIEDEQTFMAELGIDLDELDVDKSPPSFLE